MNPVKLLSKKIRINGENISLHDYLKAIQNGDEMDEVNDRGSGIETRFEYFGKYINKVHVIYKTKSYVFKI